MTANPQTLPPYVGQSTSGLGFPTYPPTRIPTRPTRVPSLGFENMAGMNHAAFSRVPRTTRPTPSLLQIAQNRGIPGSPSQGSFVVNQGRPPSPARTPSYPGTAQQPVYDPNAGRMENVLRVGEAGPGVNPAGTWRPPLRPGSPGYQTPPRVPYRPTGGGGPISGGRLGESPRSPTQPRSYQPTPPKPTRTPYRPTSGGQRPNRPGYQMR